MKQFSKGEKEIHCVLCGTYIQSKEVEKHINNSCHYSLYKCPVCEVFFWDPFINPGAEWYSHDERYSSINKSPFVEITKEQDYLLNTLNGNEKTLLDIGCGTGHFLFEAKRRGWKVTGIDFDRNATQAASSFFGINDLFTGDLKDFKKINNRRYDLITFFDVFEHLDNHKEFISIVKSLLSENGTISMKMPYADGARWLQPNDLPPRHLTRWNEKSVRLFLEDQGFEIISIVRKRASLTYILMKLRFKFGKKLTYNLVEKVKKTNSEQGKNVESENLRLNIIKKIARLKDIIFFGIPSLLIFILLLPTKKICIDLYVNARLRN